MPFEKVGDKTPYALAVARNHHQVVRHAQGIPELCHLDGITSRAGFCCFQFNGITQACVKPTTSLRTASMLTVFNFCSFGRWFRRTRLMTAKSFGFGHAKRLFARSKCSLMPRFLFQASANPCRAMGSPLRPLRGILEKRKLDPRTVPLSP